MEISATGVEWRSPLLESALDGPSRWSIVLAGGEGERLRPFIEARLGHHRPKQYCAFVGSRTMLDHTHDRAAALVGEGRRLTVLGPGHRKYLEAGCRDSTQYGELIDQPANRGTAPGIFVPLCHILEDDPDATVLVLPSDHFIYPEDRFIALTERALTAAEVYPDHLILLGATPDGAESDYGWIEIVDKPSGRDWRAKVARVERFSEKPPPNRASKLYSEGALWNTMVMAVKAKTLWNLGCECLPDLMNELQYLRRFVRAKRSGRFGTVELSEVLTHIFDHLDSADFSRAVLERVPDRILAMRLDGIHWSDWGRPDRISDTLERMGHSSAFGLRDASCFAWEDGGP